MGAMALPFPTSNNAPQPIPGGYGGNYSGLNFGGTTGQPFPTMSMYGGPAYNVGSYGTGAGLAGLNAGLFQYGQGYGTDFYNRLGTAFGKGPGQALGNLLSGQLFNPQVAAAYLNAQQPGIARGEASILGAFGDAGARFSSASALGLGDYESQVQLNQQQMLAQLYEHAQDQELSILQSVLPTLHQERADEGGWLNKVLGGIETAAGVAMLPFSGGLSAPLIGAGLKTLGGGVSKGGAVPATGNYEVPLPGMKSDPFTVGSPAWQQFAYGGADPFVQPSNAMGTMDLTQFLQ